MSLDDIGANPGGNFAELRDDADVEATPFADNVRVESGRTRGVGKSVASRPLSCLC